MDALVKLGVYISIVLVAFFAGMIKGCDKASQKYEQAETKFLIKEKEVIKIEKQQVVKTVTQIQTVDNIVTKYLKAAHAETPNPIVCDISDSRVQRVNQAISASRTKDDAGVQGTTSH